mmetsp:Transcript_97686/g.252801  ORF Transcript_97686/g.252801 Transcript_97686/m.252801 type:complete len:221 (+) Transcript_97686:470-1132(+)
MMQKRIHTSASSRKPRHQKISVLPKKGRIVSMMTSPRTLAQNQAVMVYMSSRDSRRAGRRACGSSCVRPKPAVMKVLTQIMVMAPMMLCTDAWLWSMLKYRRLMRMAMMNVLAITALNRILLRLRISISRLASVMIWENRDPRCPALLRAAALAGALLSAGGGLTESTSFCTACREACRSSSSPASVATQRMKKSGGLTSRGQIRFRDLKWARVSFTSPL